MRKNLVYLKLKNRINAAGELTVTSQSERTQFRNRNNAVKVMLDLIAKALTENPRRIPSLRPKHRRLRGLRRSIKTASRRI